MIEELDRMVDRTIYEILAQQSPDLIQGIDGLLDLGQTPLQIEQMLVNRFGRTTTTLHVRAAAEHMKRSKA